MDIAPVIIVHHADDEDVAARMEQRIRKAGYPTWRSGRDVLVGDNLHESISFEMAKNGPVVLCLGPMAIGTGLIELVGTAAKHRELEDSVRYLLPVMVAKCDARRISERLEPGAPGPARRGAAGRQGGDRAEGARRSRLPEEAASPSPARRRLLPADNHR